MGDSEVDTETETEEEQTPERAQSEGAIDATQRSVVDLDSAEAYEQRVDELTDRVERQEEEIEELKDLLLDLSVRQADGRGMGVCPECHGPVEKVRRWLGPTTIECRRCGEMFHEY
jgi:RNA polymerase-binding transcription factor DksA